MIRSDIAVGHVEAVIPDGETETALISLEQGVYAVGIYYPAIDTSTAFTFEVAYNKDATSVPFNSNDGTPKSVTIAGTAGYVPLIPADWAGVKYLKIKVADAQTGAKTLRVATRSY